MLLHVPPARPAAAGTNGASSSSGVVFDAQLTHADGKKLGPLDIKDAGQAKALADRVRAGRFLVAGVKSRDSSRQPPPPFITSTLQQVGGSSSESGVADHAPPCALLSTPG